MNEKRRIIMYAVCIVLNGVPLLINAGEPFQPEPLAIKQKTHFKSLSVSLMSQLWPNDCSPVITNAYSSYLSKSSPNTVRVELKSKSNEIEFIYADRKSDKVLKARNTIYEFVRKSRVGDNKPVFSTHQMAEKKAEVFANYLGVTNYFAKGCFENRSSSFINGLWNFSRSSFINGYPSLYHVSISITDTPEMNLYRWFNTTCRIPSNLSTNVVFSSKQSQEKAHEYLNKYYPYKDDIKYMSFNTNRVEYVTPNYCFIRKNAMEDFWDGGCTNPPVLVWKNYFDKHKGFEKDMPVVIYVDAVTGEMLGGM